MPEPSGTREQPGCGQSLVDEVGGNRRLRERFTLATRPLASDVALDLGDPWDVIQLLGHILTNTR